MSNKSEAHKALDALPEWKKLSLLSAVFQALEYDSEGNPGTEWDSDTTQSLGDLFNAYGVTFTAPDASDDDNRLCGRDGLTAEERAAGLAPMFGPPEIIDTGRYLQRALDQSAAGDVESLGSFAQYAEDDSDAEPGD